MRRKAVTKTRPEVALGALPRLLGYRLRLAQRAVFADFKQRVDDPDIGPGRFGILEIVRANPGLSQSSLALALGLDRSSLVPVLNRLEKRGLLTRHAVPQDKRSNGLHLTAEGQHQLRRLRRKVERHEARIAERLPAQERQLLMELLHKLTVELT